MNFRLTAILFGLLLIGTIVLLAISFVDDAPKVGDVVFENLAAAGVKAKDINTIEIEREGQSGKIVFVRDGEKPWELREPVNARADSAAVDRLALALLSAKPMATAETQQPLADLGLQPPSLRVTLRKGSEHAATLNLGKVSLGADRSVVFASTAAHPDRPMAIRRSELDSLFTEAAKKSTGEPAGSFARSVSEWRSLSPLGTSSPLTRITITSKKQLLVLRTDAKKAWQIEQPALGPADPQGDSVPTPNRFTGIQPLISAITGLQAVTASDFIEAPKDLKEYGLDADNPDRVTIEITTDDGKTQTVFLGKKVDKDPGKVYAQVQGDSGVFKAQSLNSDGFAAAVADPQPLRDRNLLDVDRTRIDGLDITMNGQTAALRRGPTGWTLTGAANDPRDAATLPVENILALLTERRTVHDFPKADDARFDPKEVKAEVKVHTESTGPAKKPTILIFGKSEGENVHVRRVRPDGTKTDLLLPATVLVGPGKTPVKVIESLARTRLDFLEPKLPSFSTALANRLTFTRAGNETVEVGRMETVVDPQYPNGRWEFVQPASRKGQPASTGEVDQLLNLLATAHASKFVAEQPTEAQLAGWGLDPKAPKLKVEIGLADTAEKRVYEFGNDAPDGYVYGRVVGQPEVFLISKTTAARFNSAEELRDRTLVAFDRNRLKGLKLRGWRTTDKPPTTIELERKDRTWTAKSPMGFTADTAKVDRLVNALFHARAAAFFKPIQTDYGFGVDTQNALEITLELDGLPSLVVNIGAPADGGKDFYAFCNQRPGEAVTVLAEPFKAFKDKPESLAK